MSAAVETIGLAVGYRRRGRSRAVLDGLNLRVVPGELVGLLGANGTGKSTLLRTLGRMQPPLAGAIRLGGADIGAIPQAALARLVGLVLTERVEVGALDAYRVVALGRYAHQTWSGRLTPEDHAVVRRALIAVGAGHLAARDCAELSDGERQRINIARALAQQPAVLLLDEPTAFLDAPSRVELMALLRRLARDAGLAIVIATHDIELALRTVDTVWLTAPGGAFFAGAPEDLVLAGRFAAAFGTAGVDFRPHERTFHATGGQQPVAAIRGAGLAAALAGAVLEREGFRLAGPGAVPAVTITMAADGSWTARAGGRIAGGSDYAALAAFLRAAALPARREPALSLPTTGDSE